MSTCTPSALALASSDAGGQPLGDSTLGSSRQLRGTPRSVRTSSVALVRQPMPGLHPIVVASLDNLMDLSERPSRPARRHPWEVARFQFFRAVLRDAGADQRPLSILDAGSGDGWFAERLLSEMPAGTRVTCWDASYSADDVARLGSEAPDGIAFSSERPTARFGLLFLLDFLEPVEHDQEFLAELVD